MREDEGTVFPSAVPPGSTVGDDRPLLVMLHGVNLSLLGERPVDHYGVVTLSALEALVAEECERLGWASSCHQTDHEGEYVELLHRYRRSAQAVIVNPGAWTHYSYAIRDALELVAAPVAEVHLSDIERREEWRRVSVVADVASIRIAGKGPDGYVQAVNELVALVGEAVPRIEGEEDGEQD